MHAPIFISAVVLIALGVPAYSQEIPTNAPVCATATPPIDAGEDLPQGSPMKIYPRAKDIPKGYTGCQKVWLESGGRWISFSTRYFDSGHIKVFLGPVVEGQEQIRCVIDGAVLKGRACPSLAEANRPAPSVPSGCLKELKAGAATSRCTRYE